MNLYFVGNIASMRCHNGESRRNGEYGVSIELCMPINAKMLKFEF